MIRFYASNLSIVILEQLELPVDILGCLC